MDATDFAKVFAEYQDHLAPRLDTYEQAIYLYALRLTRLVGVEDVVIPLKSARHRMACGIGEKGKPMSENTAYGKLQSLQKKGCVVILDTEREGRRVRLNLPAEIPGVIPADTPNIVPDIESEDFFTDPANRHRILAREDRRCFYCLRQLNDDNYVVEHVVSRPVGDNGYRNVVAACRNCNNRKGNSAVEDWLRTLYRDSFLDTVAFQERLSHLARLRIGELKPPTGA